MSDAGRQGADDDERRRRTWSADQKQRIIAESLAPRASVAEVSRRYGLNANMLFTWRRRERRAVADGDGQPVNIVPVVVVYIRRASRIVVGRVRRIPPPFLVEARRYWRNNWQKIVTSAVTYDCAAWLAATNG